MDAFFASVELLRYPQLRGQPVVVGGRHRWHPRQLEDGSWHFARLRDYSGRGVVTTSTYEARALGVFSAMGMMKAARLAPDAYLLPARFDAYREYSRRFKEAVAAVEARIEDRGIDEIYLVSTVYRSAVDRQPEYRRLIPLEVVEEDGAAAEARVSSQPDTVFPLYEFEPSAEEVLDALLPRYIDARIQSALLSAAAAEQAARQQAMKTATDNADDLIKTYTRLANTARQAEITQEISEIVGGVDALAASGASD